MTMDPKSESWGGIKRNACEVFSRVCGYLRPVNRWNKGKQAEFDNRKPYQFKTEK